MSFIHTNLCSANYSFNYYSKEEDGDGVEGRRGDTGTIKGQQKALTSESLRHFLVKKNPVVYSL